jgi:hypothetical protein
MADLGQCPIVADVGAAAEIGVEQRLDHVVLHVVLVGEADQPMRLHGVGRARQLLEMELDADAGGGFGDALVHLARALSAAELG